MKCLQQRMYECVARRLVAVAVVALALCVVLVPAGARAEEVANIEDAPNIEDVVVTEVPEVVEDGDGTVETISTSEGMDLPFMGNDYVWAGESLSLEGVEVQNDVLAAGRNVQVEGSKVAGSVRMAGQDVGITNTTAQENITLAGQDVSVRDSQANAVALAGQTVEFSGTCSELFAFANDVVIDGTVTGDAFVGANSVTIGEHARIEGTLNVNASQEPVVKEGATVANLEFTLSDNNAEAIEQAGSALSGLLAGFGVIISIIGVVSTLIVALCAEWLFGHHTKAAARLMQERTVATVATGVIGTFVAPAACIALCLLIVTLPIALAGALVLLAIGLVASGFAAASVAKIAFPKLGRYSGALACAAIIGVAKLVPVLGMLVSTAAYMYMVGYVLQSIYLGIRTRDSEQQEDATGASASLPTPPTAA